MGPVMANIEEHLKFQVDLIRDKGSYASLSYYLGQPIPFQSILFYDQIENYPFNNFIAAAFASSVIVSPDSILAISFTLSEGGIELHVVINLSLLLIFSIKK